MKKLTLIATILITAITFSSCSKNGDGDENNFSVKLVSQLVELEDDSASTYTDLFYYDSQNRIIKMDDSWGIMTFDYYSDKVIITENGYEKICHLNKQGYIETLTIGSYTFENHTTESYTCHYTYDANGYMTKMTYESDERGRVEVQCVWSNGDLIRESDGTNYTNYEYTKTVNKTNFDFVAYDAWDAVNDPASYLRTATNELFGKRSKHLIKAVNTYDYGHDGGATFDYELDSDGCPTKITATRIDDGVKYYSIISYK